MAESKQQQQLKEITEKLEQGVKELFTSEKYMEYLRVMSQFHNYSFSNTLLIAMQKPEATLVAGYGAWQNKFERNVKKGEKAIKIFAPAPRKVEVERDMLDPGTQSPVIDENGEVKKEKVTVQQPYFKITSVFDVSQTDGKPLPELDTVQDLTGSVEGYNIFFEALKRTSKVPMDFQPIEGGSHGFYHQIDKRIAIAEGMSEAQNVKTGIHEIAHSRLHDRDMIDAENGIMVDRRTREVQAESVAYTICQHYGIETSDYSFGYIAGWSEGKEMKELRSSMEVIRREADSMIKEIDGHLADIRREREQETELTVEMEKSFIAKYYVVEDLQVRGALQIEKFDDLETALNAYFALPNDKVRALGIENSKPRTGSLDFIHCHDGVDEIVQDYQKVEGWMNPEIVAVVDRIQTVLEEREGERKVYQMASPQSEEPAIPLTSENTEPSKALNGYSRKDVEEMVLFAAQAELEEMELTDSVTLLGARVYGSRTRDGLFEETSDIDVVLSFDAPNGVLYEDTFFNAINGNHLEIGGLSVDVNPISLQETGTLEDYMTRAEAYLDRKELDKAVYAHLANSTDREADVLQAARITFPEAKGDTLQEVLQSAAITKLREQAEVMDGIEVFGHDGVFTNGRVNKKDLPEGLFAYDLRGSDDDPGQFVTIEPFVMVNHAGAVVLSEKLDFGEKDRLELGEDWTFSGEAGMTLESFYDKVAPGKGEAVYAKDAADIAEKAVAFYGSETNLFDYLGDDRETILTDLVEQLNHGFVAYMDEKSLTTETEISISEEPTKPTIVPLSKLTFAEAKEKGEVDAWRASKKETEACAEQFDAEFGMAYHERRMPEFLAEMADKYGLDRCKIVLASTIQLADHDGRYYPSTKADAAKVEIPGANAEDYTKDIRMSYRVNCHPVMVNSAFRELQKMEREQTQAKTKEPAAVEHDSKAPKASVLSRLQEKQKQVSQNKTSPARTEDKKRGVEL